ncbi:MAG: cell surface protein SprA, partial [Bacteroidetes bacterium]|nr:cell surface protein SprA [Bacteroidota bacterium]
VRADWRKYLFGLQTPGDVNPVDPNDNTSYIVSTVNIEKNGRRQPIPYVLPPKIFRVIDPTTPNPVQQNEQSLSLAVCGLKDGDARAVFKNTKFDIRNYKKFKLFIHAEAFRNEELKDGDLSAFVRMGTDFTNNYYEIEVPLKVTAAGSSNENDIWPAINELDIDIEEFFKLKLDRIRINAANGAYYEKVLPDGKRISVVGIPDMSNLRVMMLGIRNPKKVDFTSADDGLSKCGEVWFNEMRVSGFDNPGGWAATGRITSKLADFGTFNMTGSITTVGYGGIDKKLNERARNNTMVFDVNTNLEFGKFFSQKSGVSIPFFYGYTQTILRPHFYPLNPDIPMDSILAVSNAEEAKKAKENADDFTSRRSWNLTNVRKNKTNSKKAMPWDLPNFNFTYSFNEYFKRNQNIAFNKIKTYQFVINWVYQLPIKKGIEPFKWVGKNKWLQLIHDFNFMPLPQTYSIITQTDRRYGELLNRGNDNAASNLDTLYDKNFTNKRIYDIKWDLTKALKINYNAIAQARIDEPIGAIYTNSGEGRDSIIKNIKTGGRITDFMQQTTISYTVPFNKFPLTNWITASGNYGVNYNWKTAPPALGDTVGNTISNSQNINLNGQLNFIQLYSKIKILDEINKGTWLTKSAKPIQPKENNRPSKKPIEKNPKKGEEKEDGAKEEDKTEEAKPSIMKKIINHSVKFLLMTKNVTFSYTETNATTLHGFKPKPKYFGEDFNQSAPGLDFIFGSQNQQIKYNAAQNGWLTESRSVFNQYLNATSKTFRANATLEPFQDFRIQMNWDRSYSNSYSSFFLYDAATGKFQDFTPMQTGAFSMSYLAWPTAFKKSDTASSEVFNTMQASRFSIANQLQNNDPRAKGQGIDPTNGFPAGYGPLQQDVLVNSFIAAYSGKDVKTYKTNIFPKMPAPNWRVTWNGLTKNKKIAEYFSNISISHGYSSKYSIGAYSSSLKYDSSKVEPGRPLEPQLVMQSVTISEQFSPLIGIDIATKKNFTTKFEYKKDRTMNLLTGNAQLTEQKNSEFVFGIGYRKKGFEIPFIRLQGNRRLVLEREITFKFDFSIRDQWTTIRKFDIVNGSIPTAGSKIIKIKPEINYSVSDNMTIRIFYDRTVTKPYTSNSFPTAITQFGVTVRYTLQ